MKIDQFETFQFYICRIVPMQMDKYNFWNIECLFGLVNSVSVKDGLISFKDLTHLKIMNQAGRPQIVFVRSIARLGDQKRTSHQSTTNG